MAACIVRSSRLTGAAATTRTDWAKIRSDLTGKVIGGTCLAFDRKTGRGSIDFGGLVVHGDVITFIPEDVTIDLKPAEGP